MGDLQEVLFDGEELDEKKLAELLKVNDIFVSSLRRNSKEGRLTHWELKNILLVVILASHLTGNLTSAMQWFMATNKIPEWGLTPIEFVKEDKVMDLIAYMSKHITVGGYA